MKKQRLSLTPEGADEWAEVFYVVPANSGVAVEVKVAAYVWIGMLFFGQH
jgi:hypothetical protein